MLFLAALLIVLALISYHHYGEVVRLTNRHFVKLYQRQLRLEACLEVILAQLCTGERFKHEAFDAYIDSEKLGLPRVEAMWDLEDALQANKRWFR